METFLREPWRNGAPAIGFWSAVGNSLIVEAVASSKPDYVVVDMQHGEAHDGNLVELIQAVDAGGCVPLVRVPSNNPASIMRALDSGARGVVVPLVDTAEEAARAVDACLFPPKGSRSMGPFRASISQKTSDPLELEKVACIVMIETRSGIENLEEIVATEGVTAAYIGPADLSLALGLAPGSIHAPEFETVSQSLLAACQKHAVAGGFHCQDGKTARWAIERGFKMVTVAVDLNLLRRSVAHELSEALSNRPAVPDALVQSPS
jgi:4-hydroxy-2-oxoheptanedioate aldolase